MNWEKFILDYKTQDVVLRNLEVIREASKNIAEEYKGQYPWLPWRDMAGARDKLIHHYFGVNLEVVWQIIEGDLPKVKLQIEEIFR